MLVLEGLAVCCHGGQQPVILSVCLSDAGPDVSRPTTAAQQALPTKHRTLGRDPYSGLQQPVGRIAESGKAFDNWELIPNVVEV